MRGVVILLLFLCFSFVSASCSSSQIDINTASLSDLDKLVGIGPAYAQNIIDARPYFSVDDLDKAKNIGQSRLSKIKDQGLACVSGSDLSKNDNIEQAEESNIIEEKDIELQEISSPESNIVTAEVIEETIVDVEDQSESIINLNSDIDITNEEIVYESKNEIIKKYAMYSFAFFLVFVIIILFIKR